MLVAGCFQSCGEQGRRIRCMSRRPEALTRQLEVPSEVVAGDVMDRGSLDAVMVGVDTAYYFVHSMGASRTSKTKTESLRQIFLRLLLPQVCDELSISEVWEIRTMNFPNICGVGRRQATFCGPSILKLSSFARRL